jgi:hypothetical protein
MRRDQEDTIMMSHNPNVLAYCSQWARVKPYTLKKTANESGQKIIRRTRSRCAKVSDEVIKNLGTD